MSTHRVLVYCTDDPRPRWGWWCRDCPAHPKPWTDTKAVADKSAGRHRDSGAPARPRRVPVNA